MRVVAEPAAGNMRIVYVSIDMARTLDCVVAPWGLEEAALVDTSETVAPVACNSAALAEGDEVVLHLPVLKGPPPAAVKKGRSWETEALAR
eukprot:15246093-Alexandrium_andersonii.AAC.1